MRATEPARSARKVLLESAAEQYIQFGYTAAKLQDIAEAAQLTKGAVYFHFESKEGLARAVIDEGSRRFESLYLRRLDSRTPALESLIDISYATIAAQQKNSLIKAAFRLATEVGDYRGTTTAIFTDWMFVSRALVHRAVLDGDIRDDVNPDDIGDLIVEMVFGILCLTADLGHHGRLASHMTSCWTLLLPALVDSPKISYFRQFLARRLSYLENLGIPRIQSTPHEAPRAARGLLAPSTSEAALVP